MPYKLLILTALIPSAVLAACSSTGAPPATAIPTQTVAPIQLSPEAEPAVPAQLEPQSNDAGAVTVQVVPLAPGPGNTVEFQVAMNTHSVELDADMLTSVRLRDDAGNEYVPVAWDGPAAGGHHREGIIKFPALKSETRTITLVVRNVAGVPERAFKWSWNAQP